MNNVKSRYLRLAGGRLGLRSLRDGSPGAAKLLCFPYAGGQSLGFRRFAEMVRHPWTVWGIDPPAHGWTSGPPLRRVTDMVDFYLNEIPADVLRDSILVGHSLGGLVAFAMASRLTEQGDPPPGLVLSAARPPHCPGYTSFTSLNDRELLHTMIDIGGVPSEWASEPETFDLFKEAIRADFEAFESFEEPKPLAGVSVLALGAYDDVVCRAEHVFEWARFCRDCQIDFVPGDHLFIQTPPERLMGRLEQFVSGL